MQSQIMLTFKKRLDSTKFRFKEKLQLNRLEYARACSRLCLDAGMVFARKPTQANLQVNLPWFWSSPLLICIGWLVEGSCPSSARGR